MSIAEFMEKVKDESRVYIWYWNYNANMDHSIEPDSINRFVRQYPNLEVISIEPTANRIIKVQVKEP